jgi:integrase
MDGTNRRTLRLIDHYPEPQEILEKIEANSWKYLSSKADFYKARDKALAAILYNGELRISEAQRLTLQQFKFKPFRIEAVKLSKAEKYCQKTGLVITRKDLFRKEIRLATKGARGKLSSYIKEYLTLLTDKPQDTRLFNFGNTRTDQIIKNMLGVPPHWLRAYGENELYTLWDYDLIAVANYVQVDPRTLAKYIHRTPEKYLNRE